ncbi:hypothetical protein [Mesorhizobium sp. Z1-4]|uniref:hypothetical protein n=1 Tax=Mesorhizobium sp. Z1-4 TaxID=2448478 RepID=UPI000FDCD451|nr:hypothetical protein [Mesorhizobium sp. Z1-4]
MDRPYQRARIIGGIGAVFLVAYVVIILLTIGGTAWPHEATSIQHEPLGWKYPASCCSDKDCAPLPPGAIKAGPSGYEVTILPGQHPFVKDEPFREVVPYSSPKIRNTPDGTEHGCLSPQARLICLMVGSKGF